MSNRIVVLDDTIFEQVNRGNEAVATALRQLHRADAQLWITNDLKIRLSTDADRRLLRDLNVQSPMQDIYADKPVMRRYVDRLPAGSQTAGALVIHLSNTERTSAELMTANGDFRTTFSRYYGNVVPESNAFKSIGTGLGPDRVRDYNQTRRLLQLKPLNILPSGQIPPPPPPAVAVQSGNSPPRATINGKVWVPNNNTVATQVPSKARTVQPPKVATTNTLDNVQQPPKRAAGEVAAAKAAGVELLINGVGFVLGWLADREQQRRFEADWAPKKRDIEATMAKDPTKGALVFVYYSEMQGSRQFNYIRYAFGRIEAEALQNMNKETIIRPIGAGTPVGDKVGWFAPSQPVEPQNLPTPFPAIALATFAGGRNTIMDVKWKGTSAFDDNGETKLDVPAGIEPLFLVLDPPANMVFFNGSIRHEVTIEQYSEFAAETLMPYVMPFDTVDMDCQYAWVCGNTSAAMVYPAERYTTHLFRRTPKIKDNLGQIASYGLDDMRFVEPENIKIIDDFRFKTKKP